MSANGRTEPDFSLSFREAVHLQAMEGNPLDDADLAMFEMFDREGWTAEQRRAHILREAQGSSVIAAAE
jgi:hypothetical protein